MVIRGSVFVNYLPFTFGRLLEVGVYFEVGP